MKTYKNFRLVFFPLTFLLTFHPFNCWSKNNIPEGYKGVPFKDSIYTKGAQVIPGRIECKYFDLGGEGIAYHDFDSINNGSGPYNHQPGHCEQGAEYVAYFRINEGVDLSYTKEKLDFSHPNLFTPERRQGYIGWTRDGEWCNYTVNVKKVGTYKVNLLYSNEIKSFLVKSPILLLLNSLFSNNLYLVIKLIINFFFYLFINLFYFKNILFMNYKCSIKLIKP